MLNYKNMSYTSPIINPKMLSKTEALCTDNSDLGEVQEVDIEYIVTQKGTLDKDKYYIPNNLIDRFNGYNVFLRITEEEANSTKNMRQT